MPEDINGESDNKVVEFLAGDKTETIGYLLAFLVESVLVDVVAIDELIVHVDLPAFLEHQGVFDFEGEFVFDFDVTDGEAIFEFEL